MGAVAVKAAQAVDYHNAGTIEFLLDKDKNFFFLEMNTRLQVEHPITEIVTGIDIVKEQIRIARGRPLRLKQRSIKQRGWAIECRINAEDPFNNFMPSTGTITRIERPTGPGVRIDSSMYEGFESHALLRLADRQVDLLGRVARRGHHAHAPRVERVSHHRRAHQHPVPSGDDGQPSLHRRLVRHDVRGRTFLDGTRKTRPEDERIAAVIATLVEHQREQQAAQVVRRNERDTSNWKWIARWERMQR